MTHSGALALALAGGGTGGHVVPGLHVLERFAAPDGARAGLAHVLWLGAGRPIEERVLAHAPALVGDVPLERVRLRLEPAGGGAPSRLRLAMLTAPAVLTARRALARSRSEVLLGLGGFTTLPAVLAARTLGIPVCLLEINAVAGAATRWLGGLCARVVHAWDTSVPRGADPARHLVLGPPLARAFLEPPADEAAARAAREALGLDPERPLVLVLGGSQGAAGLNRFCAEQAARLVEQGVQILHQVGPGRLAEAAPALGGYRALEYVEDVRAALDAATVVVCRGGASTLAEVAARCRPALVVPYPHHADRHQQANARALGRGVQIVYEAELGALTADELAALCAPKGARRRARMAEALGRVVPADAGSRIRDELLSLARRSSPAGC